VGAIGHAVGRARGERNAAARLDFLVYNFSELFISSPRGADSIDTELISGGAFFLVASMGATGLDFPIDPLERALYFRAKAEEFREQADDATLRSIRESYLKMASASDIMAAFTERILRPEQCRDSSTVYPQLSDVPPCRSTA
jgi:hypothetical protein